MILILVWVLQERSSLVTGFKGAFSTVGHSPCKKKTSCVSVDLKQVLDKYKTELAGTGERSGNINDSEL